MTPPDSCHCWRANALSCGLFTVASSVTWSYTISQIQRWVECMSHPKKTPQISVSPTSKLSSSFIPSCHFSNSFSQLRTVLRGQTTRAVVNFSFSQSSKVWRNVTTYRTQIELQVNCWKSKCKPVWVTQKQVLAFILVYTSAFKRHNNTVAV